MNTNDFINFLIILGCLIGVVAALAIIIGVVVIITTNNNQTSQSPSQAHHSAFRAKSIQKLYTYTTAPGLLEAPPEWGTLVPRPASVTIYYNQQKCIVCMDSIHFSYQNKGWVRCPKTKKLVHGYCYEAWISAKGKGCASCQSIDHEMEKINYTSTAY